MRALTQPTKNLALEGFMVFRSAAFHWIVSLRNRSAARVAHRTEKFVNDGGTKKRSALLLKRHKKDETGKETITLRAMSRSRTAFLSDRGKKTTSDARDPPEAEDESRGQPEPPVCHALPFFFPVVQSERLLMPRVTCNSPSFTRPAIIHHPDPCTASE